MRRSPYGRRPPYRRRDRLGFVCTALLMAFGAILGAAVVLSSRAHATTLTDPVNVCQALRDHISLANIESALEASGLSPITAGGWAGLVVRTQCPEYIGFVMGQLA